MEGASAGYCTASGAVETLVGQCLDRGDEGGCRSDPVIAVWPNFQSLQTNTQQDKHHENSLHKIVCQY